ncbi:MAG: gamma-glutamyltransferase family protein [Burkholderiales bacterium]
MTVNSTWAARGMVVAPHALAAQSGLAVLREGGNALEAMVAAAATISVVYPHMNGIGGDSFWLIHEPGKDVTTIDACGRAAAHATFDFYRAHKAGVIPARGPLAANTVAGTVSGWALALDYSQQHWNGRVPLARLLDDSMHYAEHGIVVTHSQHANTVAKLAELADVPGFGARFLADGKPPAAGALMKQPFLGATMRQLARCGLADFYTGELARSIAGDLAALGSPLALADLQSHGAELSAPVKLAHSLGTLYNMAPPTQGTASLMILGILDRLELGKVAPDSADYVHLVVEATKQAFLVRNQYITDPAFMTVEPAQLLEPQALAKLAAAVRRDIALPWPAQPARGDTVWMGAIDGAGRAVSFIQSIYHEFGSGVVLPGSGINWQNRGCSFSLDADAFNALQPRRKPFHTLNPALAQLHDGRTVVYGTMGGDGQPQTQAAVFTRYAVFGQSMQQAIAAPRWLLGRTWGQASDTLKLEARFAPTLVDTLKKRGHRIEMLQSLDETVGHAGGIARHVNGALEAGFDPRSDGAAAGF